MPTPAILLIDDRAGDIADYRGLWLAACQAAGVSQDAVVVTCDGPSAPGLLASAATDYPLPHLMITDAPLPVVSDTGGVPAGATTSPAWQTGHEKPNDVAALAPRAHVLTPYHPTAVAEATTAESHPRP